MLGALLSTSCVMDCSCLQGAIVCLHAACKTFSSLMAVRFFLGLCERSDCSV